MTREKLAIDNRVINDLNELFLDPENEIVNRLQEVIEKYGTPEEINLKAKESGSLESLLERTTDQNPSYAEDLEWLMEQRDNSAFVSLEEYNSHACGTDILSGDLDYSCAPTLEISALQYFPWIIDECRRSIEKREILPGRFIRVRNMKEQEKDGDLSAVRAATKIIGSSCVETLDTKGTDGSNIHLGGPETLTGYFGGIGQPNSYPLKWADELLYYYTNYGINEVLNINPGTVLTGYLLYRLGVDINFKISVFMGNDNPYSVFWTLFMAKLLARPDGTTPLSGFNLSNSIDSEHLAHSGRIRKELGLEEHVRIEHHITETWKSIVIQPYNKRGDLLELVRSIPNISAKHEGGDPEDEENSSYPSDILHYFRTKEEILESGDMESLRDRYLLKHISVNRTAAALARQGTGYSAAENLHGKKKKRQKNEA